jgi:hypothetical protein
MPNLTGNGSKPASSAIGIDLSVKKGNATGSNGS